MLRARKGFTSIELVVVSIVIVFFAAVIVLMMGNLKAKAIAIEAVMGASAIKQAVKSYSAETSADTLIAIDISTGSYSPAIAGMNPNDFEGTYFSKECYRGYKNDNTAELYGRCYFNRNMSAKAGAVNSMKDAATLDAFIAVDKKGEITQSNFSRSGYPPAS
jgi:type II secretory pathway pseudopilin PulG